MKHARRFLLLAWLPFLGFSQACSTGYEDRAAVIETVNRLFIATDEKDWKALKNIFTDEVDFDMTSLAGGKPGRLKAGEIIGTWQEGLKGLPVHHLAGNHLV